MTMTCILFQQLYSSNVITARKWRYVTTVWWKLG